MEPSTQTKLPSLSMSLKPIHQFPPAPWERIDSLVVCSHESSALSSTVTRWLPKVTQAASASEVALLGFGEGVGVVRSLGVVSSFLTRG